MPQQRMRRGYLVLIKKIINKQTTFTICMGLFIALWFLSWFLGNYIKVILPAIVFLLLSIYYSIYVVKKDLTIFQMIFGYKSCSNLMKSDAFFYKLLSSSVLKIWLKYPFVSLFIIYWSSPLEKILRFWEVLKSLIEKFDLFGLLKLFESLIENLASLLVPYMLAYKDEGQIVINIAYLIMVFMVTYVTCLRIKFSGFDEKN